MKLLKKIFFYLLLLLSISIVFFISMLVYLEYKVYKETLAMENMSAFHQFHMTLTFGEEKALLKRIREKNDLKALDIITWEYVVDSEKEDDLKNILKENLIKFDNKYYYQALIDLMDVAKYNDEKKYADLITIFSETNKRGVSNTEFCNNYLIVAITLKYKTDYIQNIQKLCGFS